MAENVELQGIEFQIAGDAEKAVSGIKALTSSLKKLRAVCGTNLGLGKIAQEIRQMSSAFDNKGAENLRELASSVSQIAKSDKKITNLSTQLQSISKIDFSNLTKAADAIKTVGTIRVSGKGKGGANDVPFVEPQAVAIPPSTAPGGAEKIPDTEQTKEQLKEVAAASKVLRKALVELGQSVLKDTKAFGKFSVKLLQLPFKRLSAAIKNTLAPLKQFVSSLGRIAMYRAIRSIVSGITTALKEGITNLYQYSIIMSTTFHSAMDLLATDVLYLKNGLASAVAPLIESLIPAFDILADRVVSVMNLIAQLFSTLSGRSTYSKAVKTTKQFAEASGEAAKEVRMLISGFDELNRFQDKAGNSKDDNYGLMFEESDVENEIGDLGKTLRDLIESGDWKSIGYLLGKKINSLFDGIEFDKIGIKLGTNLNDLLTGAFALLRTIDFKSIGSNIATFLNNLFENINFENAGRLFVRKITAMLDFVIGFIRNLNWDSMAKAIGDFFTGAFREASEWIRATDFGGLAKTLSDGVKKILDSLIAAAREMDWYAFGKAIGDFIGNVDWIGIFARLGEIIWIAFKGTMEGLLSTSGGRIFVALLAAVKGLGLVFTLTQGLFSAAVERWVITGISPLTTMAETLGGSLVTTITGGVLAAIGGLTVAFFGIRDALLNGLNWINATVIPAGTTLAGAGIGALIGALGGPIGAGVGALIGLFAGAVSDICILIMENWTEISQWLNNAWTAFTQFTSATWTAVTETISTTVDSCVTRVEEQATALDTWISDTWNNIKSESTATWNEIKQTVTSKFTETKQKVTQDLNALYQTLNTVWNNTKTATVTAWTALKTEASSKFMEIKNTIYTRMNEATNYLRSISWVSIGSNLVSGFLNGLKSAWSAVTSWVSSAASALTSKLKSAFKIGSPSKLWADIGTYLDLGLQEGLEGGTNRLVATASGIASAVNSAMIPSPTVPTYSVNAPAVSNGTEDYAEEESMSGILPLMEQMFAFMQTNAQSGQDIKVMIDGREVFNAVVNENRRAIQRTGESPIRV